MHNLIPHLILDQFRRQIRAGSFQAATLFVDISGFTSLTETLQQHERDGAEILTDTLEAIFAPLVREVHRRGGLIPLYAGDAFTAIFPLAPQGAVYGAADAPQQALQTAFAIQEFLAPQGQEQIFATKYGDFAIGVKAGLSAGWVHWGIPGEAGQHTFYFRGPAIDGCARAEDQAGRGEVVADHAVLRAIGEHVNAVPCAKGPYFKLLDCTTCPPSPEVEVPSLSRQDLTPFVASAVLDLTARAEFREVCPVFCSFQEPTEDALLHEFVRTAILLAERYGGYLSQIAFGDKGPLLILLFGAPVAYENSIERAAEFLLALQRQETPLRWRAGMTFGIVWAGIRGAQERSEYGAIGDAVNLAARLAMRADWGELWANTAVRELLKPTYRLVNLGDYVLKGKRDRVPLYRITGRQEFSGATLYAGPLVGRQAEVAWLRERIQPILAGRFAGILYLHGEAGVGKSRLAYALLEALASLPNRPAADTPLSRFRTTGELGAGVRWFLCPADEILRQSLNPFKYFLRHYFAQSPERTSGQNRARFDAILNRLIAGLRDLLPEKLEAADRPGDLVQKLERARSFLGALLDLYWQDSLYEQLEPKLRLENMLTAFQSLVQAESLRQPVVLLLEDLHWLDEDSQALIRVLTRHMQPYPVAILCTARYRDDGSRVILAVEAEVPQHSLEMDPLPADYITAFAGQVLGGPIAGTLAAFLGEKTGGNPFFIEQLVLDLRERGMLERDPSGCLALAASVTGVPITINAVLLARLDRLEAEVREVVQTAAVLGREFEVQILSRMLQGDTRLLIKVDQAEAQRIWVALTEMRYLFRHTLMRDAAYNMQLRARLRALHRLAAVAIEQVYAADLPTRYFDLAYHYGRAEDVAQERHYAKLAGEQAAAQFANIEAVDYFSRALDLAPEADTPEGAAERYDLLLARERLYQLQGAREAQAQDLATLAELAASLRSSQKEAVVWLRQSKYACDIGDYLQAFASAEAATAAAQAARDTHIETAGYVEWGHALQALGEYEAAHTQLTRALQLARSIGDLLEEGNALRMLGTVSWLQGNHAAAQDYYQQSLSICREMGSRLGEEKTLNDLGIVSGDLGEYDQAGAYFQESLTLIREIGDRLEEATTLSNLGLVSYYLGEYDQAQVHFQESLTIKREIGDRLGEAIALGNLGATRSAQGEYALAEAYLQQALTICQEIGSRWMQGVTLHELGIVLDALGKYDHAGECYRQALALRQELQQLHFVAEDQAGLAQLALAQGDLSQAQAHVEEVLPHLASNPALAGMRYPFRFFLNCYQVLQASGDVRAPGILTQAHTLLQERAARIADENLRQTFLNDVPTHREVLDQFAKRR